MLLRDVVDDEVALGRRRASIPPGFILGSAGSRVDDDRIITFSDGIRVGIRLSPFCAGIPIADSQSPFTPVRSGHLITLLEDISFLWIKGAQN